MRNLFVSSLALVAFLGLVSPAFADLASDRAAAIQTCREEVTRQAGVDSDAVRLDQVRPRGRGFRVDLDLWREGELTNVRCDTAQDATQTIAEISPALTSATALNQQ
jgi:hypothetical protein